MFRQRPAVWIPIVAFALGMFVSRGDWSVWRSVDADEKDTPDAFLSGGARSQKVLVEILATLKTLDERVAGIQEQLKVQAEASSKSDDADSDVAPKTRR